MSGNVQIEKGRTDTEPYKQATFDAFVTYSALGGLIVGEDGKMIEMPVYKFCQQYGVDVRTTQRWKKTEGFAMKVRQRRAEVVPLARETKAFNQLFLLGMQLQDKRAAVDALKTYLGHFSQLQLPVQRQDIKIQGGLMEVLAAAEHDGIIEGETIEPTDTDTAAGSQTPRALPNAS